MSLLKEKPSLIIHFFLLFILSFDYFFVPLQAMEKPRVHSGLNQNLSRQKYANEKTKKSLSLKLNDFFVGVPGLEPGKAGPESAVLPLHHTPN